MNWLCWHVGTVTDPKFTLVARDAKAPRSLVLCVWAALLEHAKQNNGDVSLIDNDAIGILFDADGETIGSIFLMMEERGLIEAGHIANWNKRQHQKSTQRVKEFRERVKRNETNETVSSVSRNTETHETGHTDIQTDRQTLELNSEVESSTIPASRKREPAMELPRDWVADDIDSAFARRMSLSEAEIVREQTKFAAYWSDGKGRGTRRTPKGWRATWQNWVSKATERGLGNGNQHRNTNGNGFVELIRTGAIEGIARGGGGFDEAA